MSTRCSCIYGLSLCRQKWNNVHLQHKTKVQQQKQEKLKQFSYTNSKWLHATRETTANWKSTVTNDLKEMKLIWEDVAAADDNRQWWHHRDPACHRMWHDSRSKGHLRGHVIKIWKVCTVHHTWTIQRTFFSLYEVKHRVTNLGCTNTRWLKGTKSSDNRRTAFHRQTAAQTWRASALSNPVHRHTHPNMPPLRLLLMALHWPGITHFSGLSTYGLTAYKMGMSTPPKLLWGVRHRFTFYLVKNWRILQDQSYCCLHVLAEGN